MLRLLVGKSVNQLDLILAIPGGFLLQFLIAFIFLFQSQFADIYQRALATGVQFVLVSCFHARGFTGSRKK